MKFKDYKKIKNKDMKKRNKTSMIILHCAATPEGKDFTVDDIRRWHKQRGFEDVGYHYVIYRDGTVHKGRDENLQGAHCLGKNAISVGVCYIGGCDKNNKPKDTRTQEQKDSLLNLVYLLLQRYHLTINDVHAHYEFCPTKACPSFDINSFRLEYVKEFDNLPYVGK